MSKTERTEAPVPRRTRSPAPAVALGTFLTVWIPAVSNGQAVPIGGDFEISQATTRCATRADVALAPDGKFVVTWTTTGADRVMTRRYDTNGSPLENEQSLTSSPAGDPSVGIAANGDFVIADSPRSDCSSSNHSCSASTRPAHRSARPSRRGRREPRTRTCGSASRTTGSWSSPGGRRRCRERRSEPVASPPTERPSVSRSRSARQRPARTSFPRSPSTPQERGLTARPRRRAAVRSALHRLRVPRMRAGGIERIEEFLAWSRSLRPPGRHRQENAG